MNKNDVYSEKKFEEVKDQIYILLLSTIIKKIVCSNPGSLQITCPVLL